MNHEDLEALQKQFLSGQVVLVDVREQDEWDEGHVQGALLLPLSHLQSGDLPDDLPKDRPIALHCRSGKRVHVAAAIMKPLYPKLLLLAAGFEELRRAGFPTE